MKRDRKLAKFWLAPGRMAYSYGFSDTEMNRIADIARKHEADLSKHGMTTSSVPTTTAAAAQKVRVTDRALVVELRDGRVVSVPLTWYPRLAKGSPRERRRWELLGPGIGIHWPELDEDISVEGLLAGARSGESATSLNSWRAKFKRMTDRVPYLLGVRVQPERVQSGDYPFNLPLLRSLDLPFIGIFRHSGNG